VPVALGVRVSLVADGVTDVGVSVGPTVGEGDEVMVGVGVGRFTRQRAKCTSDPAPCVTSTHVA
jgi:hypothetical protein